MYVIVAIIQESPSNWKMKKIPVLEHRAYEADELYQKLGIYLTGFYKQMWLASCSIPISKAFKWVEEESKVNNKTINKIMKQCSELWNVSWKKIQPNINTADMQHELVDQAIQQWNLTFRTKLEGKLLHLYELQKSVNNISMISLDVLFDYLLIWCWFDFIHVHSGLKQKSNFSPLKLVGMNCEYECRRCANIYIKRDDHICYSCKGHCFYCDQCVQLGKVKSCSLLLSIRQHSTRTTISVSHCIEMNQYITPYHLSSAQCDAVTKILKDIGNYYNVTQKINKYDFLKKKKNYFNYLIWAVTGAGKTEMIFPLLYFFLTQHKKVLIAIPRRDVVQELHPRISKAFPEHRIVALYGGSKEIWQNGDVYISTTHQLLRFDTYFDLVILDEMDAFPYYNNPMLVRTLKRVQREGACFIQLTATVPKHERIQIMLRRQRYVKVPVRFHRNPLPVPTFIKTTSLSSILYSKQLPTSLKSIIGTSYQRGAVLFIFLQRKRYLEPFTVLLKAAFPQLNINYTSAEDEERETKVDQFRNRTINVLVTTSILERGVTIKKSDICIVDAHQRAFSRTAIVQMSGRAGRSIEDPNGFVYLLGIEKTPEIKGAINEIMSMNRLARKKGYIKDEH